RLVRQLHRHPEGVAAVVHAEEDEHLAVDLGDALPPGVFLGGLRQAEGVRAHFFPLLQGVPGHGHRLPPGSSSASASHTLASATDSGAAERPRGVMSRLDRTDRPYDIVLFGATGFVGRLTAEYLAAHAPEGLRWAVAGRSTEKLERLRDGLPGAAGIGVLRADVSEPATLRALAEQSRVVATTVGPYVHHGEELVAACADLGTDYLDLTGEPEFVDLMYVRYDTRARETGARLVHACGFDSVPHDLGAYYTVRRLPRGVPLTVDGYVRADAAFSGGTFASALNQLSRHRQLRAAARDRRRHEPRLVDRRVSAPAGGPRYAPEVDA